MFAISFDLVVADAARFHPVGVRHGFTRVQGSLYVNDVENLAVLFAAMNDLHATPWFRNVVRDIRAFRVEQWSDFTAAMRAP